MPTGLQGELTVRVWVRVRIAECGEWAWWSVSVCVYGWVHEWRDWVSEHITRILTLPSPSFSLVGEVSA